MSITIMRAETAVIMETDADITAENRKRASDRQTGYKKCVL